MKVLVDTSVWSLALRRKSEAINATEKLIVAELTELIGEGRAAIIGLVRQELLSGVKTSEQYEKLRLHLRSFDDELVDRADYEDAAKFGNQCRTKGIAVFAVDLLICAVAVKRGWAIFTTDPDFATYAKVLPVKLHRPRKAL
ncbi:MAG TPA: PIN domain-containing protein [Candidatus Binatus sp.]|nr:PIN domain-containing protein [Candidatus Binatus sp.]